MQRRCIVDAADDLVYFARSGAFCFVRCRYEHVTAYTHTYSCLRFVYISGDLGEEGLV